MILTTTARFTNMQAENMISEHLWHNTTCRHPPPRQSLHVVIHRCPRHYMSSYAATSIITGRHLPLSSDQHVNYYTSSSTTTSIITRRHPSLSSDHHVNHYRSSPAAVQSLTCQSSHVNHYRSSSAAVQSLTVNHHTSTITRRHLPLFSH